MKRCQKNVKKMVSNYENGAKGMNSKSSVVPSRRELIVTLQRSKGGRGEDGKAQLPAERESDGATQCKRVGKVACEQTEGA